MRALDIWDGARSPWPRFISCRLGAHETAPGGLMALSVKLWGDLACFTMPEYKAERVSYPVMTPSAARGALEAIFWKPEFSWQVRAIQVLKPIRRLSTVRNEVNTKLSLVTAARWADHGRRYFAEEDRGQRHTLALRDVAYIVLAD